MSLVDCCFNTWRAPGGSDAALEAYGPSVSRRVRAFHRSFPEYAPTPLVRLEALAAYLGLGSVCVKDESRRFGLNAFKVLGGSWAIGRQLAARLDLPLEALTRDALCSAQARQKLGDITFVTATDGNHGRGVAWTAAQLGQKAVVFMPEGSAEARVRSIRETGAVCTVTDLNYDATVRLAARYAGENNGVLLQDTAWEGYEEIPRWIMQGYTTLADEADEQLRLYGLERPSHIFLQAGVGAFAAAVLAWFAARWGEEAPTVVTVEPRKADCIFRSIGSADGLPHAVTGSLDTIMAGLACGEPSTVSWGILRDHARAALACDDRIAASGMRILAAPCPGDTPVVSGESGAVTLGALEHVMRSPHTASMRLALGLGADARVLLVSTEGDTSPQMYRDVVWYGRYA